MENIALATIILPMLLGSMILAGLWALTWLMPGEPKSGKGAELVAAPAYGPDYVRLSTKRHTAYRTGLMVLLGLAVLTIVEFILAPLNSAALMFVIMILKAAVIMSYFMHMATVWRNEEAH
ncbi:MAG: cytochrome C oxidase subunit IV family protein [Caldilineales bacterium]